MSNEPAPWTRPWKGRNYTGPNNVWFTVMREWKYRVLLVPRGLGHGTHQRTIFKTEIVEPEYREHKMGKTIKKGELMIVHGEPCCISTFNTLGGNGFLGVSANWGYGGSHIHENLIPFGDAEYLMNEGLRLPFEGELDLNTPDRSLGYQCFQGGEPYNEKDTAEWKRGWMIAALARSPHDKPIVN